MPLAEETSSSSEEDSTEQEDSSSADDSSDEENSGGSEDFASWSSATAPTGKEYWYNRTTGARSWEAPAALREECWEVAIDGATGHAYYSNSITEQVSWVAPPIEAFQWSEHVDPATQLAYRSNALTGETVWAEPAAGVRLIDGVRGAVKQSEEDPFWFRCLTDGSDGEERPYFFHKGTEEARWVSPTVDLAWEEAVDPTSGARYAFNTLTDEKKWVGEEDELAADMLPLAVADGGWAQYPDEASGEAYWYHEESGERSWLHPSEQARGRYAPWYRYIDEETGRPFYYNTETDERAWLPTDSAAGEEGGGGSPSRWFEDLDDDGREFWFNPATGEKSWLSPEVQEAYRPGVVPPWYQFEDDVTGALYWYNAETDEKTWDPVVAGGEAYSAGELAESSAALAEVEEEARAGGNAAGLFAAFEEASFDSDSEVSSESGSDSDSDSDSDSGSGSGSGLGGWDSHVDPRSQRTYWFNRATGERSWSPPASLPVAEVAAASDGGWRAHSDPATGNTYWSSRATGETTWTDPVPVAVAVAESRGGDVDVDAGEDTSAGASAGASATHVAVVVAVAEDDVWKVAVDPASGRRYRYRNGVTEWLGDVAVAVASDGGDDDDDVWQVAVDPTSGRSYRHRDGVTEWVARASDEEERDAASSSDSESDLESEEESSGLPSGWATAADPSSGRTYWFNRATGERSWSPPVAAAAAAAAGGRQAQLDAFGDKLESLRVGVQRMSGRVRTRGAGGAGAVGAVGAAAAAAATERARGGPEAEERARAVVLLDETITKLRVLEKKAQVMESEFTGRGLLTAALGDGDDAGSATSGGGSSRAAPAAGAASATTTTTSTRRSSAGEIGRQAVRGHIDLAEAQKVAAAKARIAALPQGWKVTADKATGKEYFFNRKSGQTQWHHPAAAVAAAMARDAVEATR